MINVSHAEGKLGGPVNKIRGPGHDGAVDESEYEEDARAHGVTTPHHAYSFTTNTIRYSINNLHYRYFKHVVDSNCLIFTFSLLLTYY